LTAQVVVIFNIAGRPSSDWHCHQEEHQVAAAAQH
jgi:hypothetical protein